MRNVKRKTQSAKLAYHITKEYSIQNTESQPTKCRGNPLWSPYGVSGMSKIRYSKDIDALIIELSNKQIDYAGEGG